MRSNAGDAYSSNEWVFIDLRAARALELQGNASYSQGLFAWNVDQASDNFGEFSELHDPTTADYAGQSPMVGFGAGAYLLSLYDRGKPASPTCGAFASEPPNPSDGGSAGAEGGTDGGGAMPDAGGGARPDSGVSPVDEDAGAGTNQDAPHGTSGGCGCVLGDAGDRGSALVALAPLALLAFRRRRASSKHHRRSLTV
jgi:MYXO-CTERM domain-containing protein